MSADGTRLRPHIVAIGLIAVLLFCIAAGAGFLFWKGFEDTRTSTRARAMSGAQVVSANVQWAFETARQVLRRVDDSLGADITVPPPDAAQKLGDAIANLPGSVKVYVVDAGGTTRLTTDPAYEPTEVIGYEYFTAVEQGAPWHISAMLISRLNGEQIFTLSKRIERDGKFAGAAILSFNSQLMQRVWQSLNLDPDSTVSLMREDRQLVSRYPPASPPVDLSRYVLFTDYLPKAPDGVYDAISPNDGVKRVVGYRRVPGTPLIALTAISQRTAYAAFTTASLSLLALAVPAALALMFIAYWTSRLLQRDAQRSENEAQFRLFAEAMPNHVWTARPDGTYDWFNSRTYEYTGVAPGTLDLQVWVQVVHPDDVPTLRQRWRTAVAGGTHYENEFRARRFDGVYRWHIARAVPIRAPDGRIERWLGTNTDIDDQKQVAHALADSERRLHLAIEAGQMAVWEYDPADRRVMPSPALNRLYGFPEDAAPTLDEYQSRFAAGELERLARAGLDAEARGDRELEIELRQLWPDGTEKWLLLRAQSDRAADGTPGRAIGVVIDITERKRVEQQLLESERRFRLSQHAAGIASLELDIESGTVLGSEGFWALWGIAPCDSVHITTLEELILPEDRAVASSQEGRLAGIATPSVEYRIRRPDTGEVRWVSRHIEFVNDEDGRPLKMFGVMQDITEQKDAQARQEMLTHELEHRIKNILAMVSAIAAQTLKDVDLDTARTVFTERLRALANAHDVLNKTRWTEASLTEVVTATVAPLPRDRVSIDGPEVDLQPKMALSLALAVNELGTNALKYGALSNATGRVDIRWTLQPADSEGDPQLIWTWSESGGPEVVPPARRGFGTFLVSRVLAADFGGKVNIEYLSTGVRATLVVLLRRAVVPAQSTSPR